MCAMLGDSTAGSTVREASVKINFSYFLEKTANLTLVKIIFQTESEQFTGETSN